MEITSFASVRDDLEGKGPKKLGRNRPPDSFSRVHELVRWGSFFLGGGGGLLEVTRQYLGGLKGEEDEGEGENLSCLIYWAHIYRSARFIWES